MKTQSILIITLYTVLSFTVRGQESIAPILYNPLVKPQTNLTTPFKTTSITLPFFEDFDGYDAIPDTVKWVGQQVYVNNTMASKVISRGVATFDALNQFGKPYDTLNPSTIRYADSLTSKALDLSSFVPSDSIYLSFFYQAGGIGFTPEKSDSLMLFFKSKTGGLWRKVWSLSDTQSRDFKQVLIAVTDTNYLYNGFQFRWVNKASVGINDDVWNIDYIKINSGRNRFDTLINDVAYAQTPSSLLKDYYSMPYRQYLANPSAERASNLSTTIRNNFTSTQTISNYGYEATKTLTSIASDAGINKNIGARSTEEIVLSSYSSTPTSGHYDRVVFENKFYLQAPAGDTYRGNDTIIGHQIFDNYLAYDDGSAEMSYFLNLFPTLPGKIAIEHHLNRDDTLRGVAIYFGRQVPLASSKFFSVEVYETIAYGTSSTDKVLYRIENLKPEYQDTINHFWIYKFDKPVPVKSGTFYIGTTQPALSGSDSLYFGLDRNRVGANFAYYNVLNVWTPSLVSGAIMIRPIMGQEISGSIISEKASNNNKTPQIWPNPTTDRLFVRLPNNDYEPMMYDIFNTSGQQLIGGNMSKEECPIDISQLSSGHYFIQFYSKSDKFAPITFIKK